MHPNGIAEGIHTAVPDMLHQLLLTNWSALMQKQIFQNPLFLSGQTNLLPIYKGFSGAGVKGNAAANQGCALLNELPACQAAHPCRQLLQMKGLFQIIVRPCIQARNLIRNLTACG